MSTTIQVSEDIQKKLFQLINSLERQWGHRVTYNDAIAYLLDGGGSKIADRKVFLKNVEKFRGILHKVDGEALLRESRRLDDERDKSLTRD